MKEQKTQHLDQTEFLKTQIVLDLIIQLIETDIILQDEGVDLFQGTRDWWQFGGKE